MQSADAKLSRNSLLLALRRYSSTVHNMEQTVLLPSLLRDVPYDDASNSNADLYQNYLMLKAVRTAVESGRVPHDDTRVKSHTVPYTDLEPLLEDEPETLFHFHLHGLFTVMATLTKTSHNLTQKYLEIVGISR